DRSALEPITRVVGGNDARVDALSCFRQAQLAATSPSVWNHNQQLQAVNRSVNRPYRLDRGLDESADR
ncbi:MAG TPA: hypothetical protein VNV16_04615, partial [Methylibium sp.]|nr:hypothetical protein [Methylibium sp.]